MKKLSAIFLSLALIVAFAFPGPFAEAIEISADARTIAAFSETVTPAIFARQEEIDISSLSLSPGQLSAIFQAYSDLEPLSFPLAQHYSYSYNPSVSVVKTIYLSYKDNFPDAASIAEGLALYEAAVDDIIGGIHGDWSEEAVLVYVLNYLCSHYTYDYGYTVSDVYNFVLQKKGVCQAFTLFTAGVLRKAGIVYDTVVSRNLNHIWNRVRIGGVWYHIDFTWANSNSEGIVNYDYFLRGEESFRSNHVKTALDWTSQTDAADAGDDLYYAAPYLWYNCKSPFVYSAGYWYYCVLSPKTRAVELMKTSDFITGQAVATAADGRWYKSADVTYYYVNAYSSLALSGRNIIFNTPSKLFAYDPLTGTSVELLDVSGSYQAPQYIYGFEMTSEYEVRLNIRNAPSGGSDSAEGFVTCLDYRIPDEFRLSPGEAAVKQGAVYSLEDGVRRVLGIPAGTPAGDIVNALAGQVYAAGRVNGENVALKAGDFAGTGARLSLGNTEYRLIVNGDVDGDGISDGYDSVYLLKALLSGDGEAYPVYYYQDYNGDGTVDTDDAVYLLKHSLNGDLYPISVR